MTLASDLLTFSRKRLERLESSLETALATGDVEAVHDVRVASRRLAEPLDIMAHFLGVKRIKRARRLLRHVRRAFQSVRDLDVMQMALGHEPTAPGMNPNDLAQLEGVLTGRRERALRDARSIGRELTPARVSRAVSDLFCDFDHAVEERHNAPMQDYARSVWRDRASALLDDAPPDAEGANLHDTRIRLKQLRYSTELLLRLEGREDDELLHEMAGMQDLLGSWNDHLVAAAEMARIARKEDTLARQPVWAAHLLEYAAARAIQADAGRAAILSAWPAVRDRVRAALDHSISSVDHPAEAPASPS